MLSADQFADPGTILREIQRGTTKQRRSDWSVYSVYFPETGQAVYEKRRLACAKPFKATEAATFLQFAETKILKETTASDKLLDIFDAAGLRKPDFSILSDQFLDELVGSENKNYGVFYCAQDVFVPGSETK